MNKHTHNTSIHAARLAVLLAGSAAVAALPSSMAAADSHIQTAAPNAPLNATAHVDFKIIIPQVLSLRVAGPNDRALGAQTVAVMSNSRNVTLHATIGGPGILAGGGNIILSAAGRRIIAQDALCEAARGRPGTAADRDPVNPSLLCTVSIP